MSFQKMFNFHSEFAGNSCDLTNLFGSRFSQAGHRPELHEEALLTRPTDAGTVIEDTFLDSPLHQQLVIPVGKAVRFIPYSLQ